MLNGKSVNRGATTASIAVSIAVMLRVVRLNIIMLHCVMNFSKMTLFATLSITVPNAVLLIV